MKEYVFAFSAALLFTLVLSCGDNQQEKKANEEIGQAYQRAQNTYGDFIQVQNELESRIKDVEEEHRVFSEDQEDAELDPEHRRLWESQLRFVEDHKQLVNELQRVTQRADSLQQAIDESNADAVREESKKIHAEIAEHAKRSDRLQDTLRKMEEMHDAFSHGHRTDVH